MTSGKPEKLGTHVIPFMQNYIKRNEQAHQKNKIAKQTVHEQPSKMVMQEARKKIQQQTEETQRINKKYHQLMKQSPFTRKSAKQQVKQTESAKQIKLERITKQNKEFLSKFIIDDELIQSINITKLDRVSKVPSDHMRLISCINQTDPLLQLDGSDRAIENRLKQLLMIHYIN